MSHYGTEIHIIFSANMASWQINCVECLLGDLVCRYWFQFILHLDKFRSDENVVVTVLSKGYIDDKGISQNDFDASIYKATTK